MTKVNMLRKRILWVDPPNLRRRGPTIHILQQLYSVQKRLIYDAATKSGRITYHAARNDHKNVGCLPRLATEVGTGRVMVEVFQTHSSLEILCRIIAYGAANFKNCTFIQGAVKPLPDSTGWNN